MKQQIEEADKKKIVNLILVLFPEAKIYLFGSRARGTNSPGSDIDLAIDVGRRLSTFERGQIKGVLDGLYYYLPIDVVDVHAVPDDLRNHIITEGIKWTK